MTWREICHSEAFLGRWVALDNVRYDPDTAQPSEADVVDVDEDLAELCARMREGSHTSCSILFCEEDASSAPVSWRPSAPPPRAIQH